MEKIQKLTEESGQFLRDVQLEVQRITWPNRNETIKSTVAVLSISALFAIFLAIADYIFSFLIGSILSF